MKGIVINTSVLCFKHDSDFSHNFKLGDFYAGDNFESESLPSFF